MTLLSVLLALPAVLLLLLCAWLVLEVVAGVSAPAERRDVEGPRGAVAIIVPAHDEASVIRATLADLRAQLGPGDALLVVADNCTDETAAIARDAGAEVIERRHDVDRGKGFALQFGLDHLRAAPPDVVLIVDADCRAGPGLVDCLARAAASSGRPVQALDLMRAPSDAPVTARVAEFAWLLINKTRMTGLSRLFGVTRLLGTGMGFPWTLAATLQLGTDEIVEDLALAIELAGRGKPPLFVPSALVTSSFPLAADAVTTQRARWEIGSLRLAREAGLPMLGRSLRTGRWRSAALALDMMVPPLTVLGGLLGGAVLWGGLLVVVGLTLPLVAALTAAALFWVAIVIAWLAHGREALPPAALSGLGAYLVSKLGVYGGRGRASARSWTRTGRD